MLRGEGGTKIRKLGDNVGTKFKFGQLILGKINKIVATRCHILGLKCTKFDFGWGSAPDTAGSSQRSSKYLTGFEGVLLLREKKGIGGNGREEKGRGRKGRKGKGSGRKGGGRLRPLRYGFWGMDAPVSLSYFTKSDSCRHIMNGE